MNVLRTARVSLGEAGAFLKAVKGGARGWASARGWHSSSICAANRQKTLAIYREEYNVWERRAPLSPAHVQTLTREGVKVRW